jgi:hypothetical protein
MDHWCSLCSKYGTNLILVPNDAQLAELFRFLGVISCSNWLADNFLGIISDSRSMIALNLILVIVIGTLLYAQRPSGGKSFSLAMYVYMLNPLILFLVLVGAGGGCVLGLHVLLMFTLWAQTAGWPLPALLSALLLGAFYDPAYLLLGCCIVCLPATGSCDSSRPQPGSMSAQLLGGSHWALLGSFLVAVLGAAVLHFLSDEYGGAIRFLLELGLRKGGCGLPTGGLATPSEASTDRLLSWFHLIIRHIAPSKQADVDVSGLDLSSVAFETWRWLFSVLMLGREDGYSPSEAVPEVGAYLPSAGVWWYLQAQIFGEYRNYMTFLLRTQPFLYAVPIIARFRDFPACGDHVVRGYTVHLLAF